MHSRRATNELPSTADQSEEEDFCSELELRPEEVRPEHTNLFVVTDSPIWKSNCPTAAGPTTTTLLGKRLKRDATFYQQAKYAYVEPSKKRARRNYVAFDTDLSSVVKSVNRSCSKNLLDEFSDLLSDSDDESADDRLRRQL